jgi:apoptosis-inducing factor 3
MSIDEAGPPGPDLTLGVAVSEVPEGGMLAGHVNGNAVLLSLIDGGWFAIGAVCSHYGGPLGEGLRVGDSVRCPWHHACFSLKTGKSLRPPGLNDVGCWRVEQRGDRVFVTGKMSVPPNGSGSRRGGRHPESVVIVGAGAAGESAAETLRQDGYEGPITLVDPDPAAPYDRPNLSKDYLAGSAPEEWIPLHPPEFYRDRDIEIVRNRVMALEPQARRVRLEDGSTRSYGALLLATGATPVRLPPDVTPRQSPIYYLRSLADSKAIIAAAANTQRAVIFGTSFIGLEVAASLRARKLDVHVVGPDAVPLQRVLGAELGSFIRELHEEHGVVFHLGQKPVHVTEGMVTLDNGERLPADLVVAGIGVQPNVALAKEAGLTVDRGVAVDEHLETSAPAIFAVGDIARWPDPHTGQRIRVEHWVVAQRQGQAAAHSILGNGSRFDAVPFFWSQHYDVPINYVGHAERWDALDVTGNIPARDCIVRFQLNGHTLAVATIYRDRESLQAEVAMERASSLVNS